MWINVMHSEYSIFVCETIYIFDVHVIGISSCNQFYGNGSSNTHILMLYKTIIKISIEFLWEEITGSIQGRGAGVKLNERKWSFTIG